MIPPAWRQFLVDNARDALYALMRRDGRIPTLRGLGRSLDGLEPDDDDARDPEPTEGIRR